MVSPLSRLEKTLQFLASVCTLVSGVCLVILVATFGWLVFGRYVMNDTPTWVEQLSMLLIITITFISSAAGVQERTHLCVDILPMMCREKTRAVMRILTAFILGAFGAAMAYYAQGLVEFAWYKRIPLLNISEGIRYIPVMVSGALVALFCAGRILNEVCVFLPGRKHSSVKQQGCGAE